MNEIDNQASIDLELRQSAIQFGRDLRRWRLRSGWAQDTAMAWGQLSKFPHVFSSTWSELERGLMSNPGPKIFLALAEQNRRIAEKNWSGLRGGTLGDRVRAADPVLHDDGEPWDAGDYFACYIGLLRWPHPQIEPPQISAAQAKEWSEGLREAFQATADELRLSPLEAAMELLERGPEGRQEREQLQRVILGFEDYDPADLVALWQEDSESPVLDVVDRWRRGRGLPALEMAPPWGAVKPS